MACFHHEHCGIIMPKKDTPHIIFIGKLLMSPVNCREQIPNMEKISVYVAM